MSDFIEYAPRYFDFLTERFGFRRTLVSPTRLRYEGDSLYFEVTTDERDGSDVHFGRVGHPGIVEGDPHELISLTTVSGAVQAHLGAYKQWARPAEQDLAALSRWLAEYADVLIDARPELYRQLRELRWWHVGDWTRQWGKSIVMSLQEIDRNRQLVSSIVFLIRNE